METSSIKNRTREEIIAAFRESIKKKHEWERQAIEELAEMRKNQMQIAF